jgi:hypothetical protein
LKRKRTWIGTQTIRIPIGEISGATDNLVLKRPLEEMDFSGGESATADSLTEETALAGASQGGGRPISTGSGYTDSDAETTRN